MSPFSRKKERIQAKIRDSQLYGIFVNQFEYSPKTAEVTINIVKEVYEINRFNPDQMCKIDQTIRQIVSIHLAP
ncbi:MAG: hypothetical protein STSR0004_21410 [Peptococcaceae bacterium]